jgi:hypothetical protein
MTTAKTGRDTGTAESETGTAEIVTMTGTEAAETKIGRNVVRRRGRGVARPSEDDSNDIANCRWCYNIIIGLGSAMLAFRRPLDSAGYMTDGIRSQAGSHFSRPERFINHSIGTAHSFWIGCRQ